MRNKIKAIFPSLGILLVVILLWDLIVDFGFITNVVLPSPLNVYRSLIELFVKNNFLRDIIVSIFRVGVGFLIASALAIPLGILMALNRKIRILIEPYIDFIRYTPIPAFIPLFIIWFGVGEMEKIFVITSAVFFQLVLMIVNSVSAVPSNMVDSAKMFGLSGRHIVYKVIFPYSKPRIFEDIHISVGWAWAALMMAEIVGSRSGIGFVIVQSQRLLQTDKVIAAIVVIGILGVVFDYLFRVLYKIFFPWTLKNRLYD